MSKEDLKKFPIYTKYMDYYFYIYPNNDMCFQFDCYNGNFSLVKGKIDFFKDEREITKDEFLIKVGSWDYFIKNNLLQVFGFNNVHNIEIKKQEYISMFNVNDWVDCTATSFGELNNEKLFTESEVKSLISKFVKEIKHRSIETE